MFLFPLIALVRIKEKIFIKGGYMGTKTPIKILNDILNIIFSIEKYVLNFFNLPFGVSILVVAKAEKKD
jgi:hypothetical protein